MSSIFKINNLSELPACAAELLHFCGDKKIIAFYGEMGAGKTTIIQALCKALRVTDTVSSPTFSIVNEYRIINNEKVFHFDFYRIKDIREAYDLGYEDYFYSGSLCLIEWPEMVEELLPASIIKVTITRNNDQRIVSFS